MAMVDQRTTELASEKVKELRRALEVQRMQHESLAAEMRRTHEQLTAWLIILKAESPVAHARLLNKPEASMLERAEALRRETEDDNNQNAVMSNAAIRAGMTATDVTRLFIRGAPAGVTPKDVLDFLRSRGYAPSDGFASNILFKFKKRGDAVERDGRYYWRANQTPA